MSKTLSTAEINHLRRLLGWVECEIGQTTDELIATAKKIAPAVGEISEEGRQRMIESAEKADRVPAYIRQAVKMLRKATREVDGEIVDVEATTKARTAGILNAGDCGPRGQDHAHPPDGLAPLC